MEDKSLTAQSHCTNKYINPSKRGLDRNGHKRVDTAWRVRCKHSWQLETKIYHIVCYNASASCAIKDLTGIGASSFLLSNVKINDAKKSVYTSWSDRAGAVGLPVFAIQMISLINHVFVTCRLPEPWCWQLSADMMIALLRYMVTLKWRVLWLDQGWKIYASALENIWT